MKFLPIKLVQAGFDIDVILAERLFMIVCASNSFDGICNLTPRVINQIGMTQRMFNTVLKSLVTQGFLIKKGKCKYVINLNSGNVTGWLNIEYFNMILESALSYKDKLVGLTIAKYINKNKDYCWPKMETIAKLLRVSIRTIQRVLSNLLKIGLFSRFKKGRFWVFQIHDIAINCKLIVNSVVSKIDEKVNSVAANMSILSYRKKGQKKKETEEEGQIKNVFAFTPNNKKQKDNKKKQKRERGGSVVQVFQQIVNKKPIIKDNCTGLSYLWRRLLPKVLDLGSVQENYLTQKQVVLFKHVLRVCNVYSINPQNLITDVLQNWDVYTEMITAKLGLKYTPNIPTIEFVIKYMDVVCQCYSEIKQEKNPVQLIAKDKVSPQKPILSIESILNGYNEECVSVDKDK